MRQKRRTLPRAQAPRAGRDRRRGLAGTCLAIGRDARHGTASPPNTGPTPWDPPSRCTDLIDADADLLDRASSAGGSRRRKPATPARPGRGARVPRAVRHVRVPRVVRHARECAPRRRRMSVPHLRRSRPVSAAVLELRVPTSRVADGPGSSRPHPLPGGSCRTSTAPWPRGSTGLVVRPPTTSVIGPNFG